MNINLHYLFPTNVVAWAEVDDDIGFYLQRWTWYLGERSTAKSPKTTLRINRVQRNLLMNRLVYTLSPLDHVDRISLCSDLPRLLQTVAQSPRLRPKNGDMLNLTFANLEAIGEALPHALLQPIEFSKSTEPSTNDILARMKANPLESNVLSMADFIKAGGPAPLE